MRACELPAERDRTSGGSCGSDGREERASRSPLSCLFSICTCSCTGNVIVCTLVQGDVETRADLESILLAKSDKRVSSCPCATWVLISPQGSGL